MRAIGQPPNTITDVAGAVFWVNEHLNGGRQTEPRRSVQVPVLKPGGVSPIPNQLGGLESWAAGSGNDRARVVDLSLNQLGLQVTVS